MRQHVLILVFGFVFVSFCFLWFLMSVNPLIHNHA